MSLYNLIHGRNPLAFVLLSALGLVEEDVPRFRDCYWNGEHICIYTRTGGGNREEYEGQNDALTTVAGYVRDEDDDFDCTYATFYFKPSEPMVAALAQLQAEDATPAQKWQSFFDRLHSGVDDEQTKRVFEAVKPMMTSIADALKAKP